MLSLISMNWTEVSHDLMDEIKRDTDLFNQFINPDDALIDDYREIT